MKKTLLFLIAATAMMMAGCSNDDFGGATQGMTLNATVEQPASRATMDEGEKGTYKFSFAVNDMLNVTNSQVESYYTFTKQGETFTSTNAQTTTAAADWYAYFPGNTVNLAGQTGDLADVANHYACAGMTASATTGVDGLTISLTPKVAILRIVKVDGNSTTCYFNVKTSDGKWVSGLTAKNNEAGFDVVTSESKVTLLTASEPGTYYIAVPAGVQITIYNGDTKFKATKAAGLTAGKYYTVTTGPVRGTAKATINDETTDVDWVQLWAGGPKFATQNVAKRMYWTTAVKNEFWGGNWRVPTKDEMGLSANDTVNVKKVNAVYCLENGVLGFKFTGITPGYTNVSLFLPANSGAVEKYGEATYWTATQVGSNKAGYRLSLIGGGDVVANCHYADHGYDGESYVRPVLVENDNPNTAQ